ICAIPKLTATSTNATLADKDAPLVYAPIDFPPPSFSVAIEPQSKADLDKLGSALHKLTDEDPSLHVRRDDATHETILSGIGESAEKGVIAGYPLSDFRATLTDGSYHAVDSNEMSFRIAGSLALQACVKEADAYLLEPIHDLEVLVPEEQMGDVLADLNSRRG